MDNQTNISADTQSEEQPEVTPDNSQPAETSEEKPIDEMSQALAQATKVYLAWKVAGLL